MKITLLFLLTTFSLSIGASELTDEYLLLELSMGRHDPGHVDAYFGPERYQQLAESAKLSIEEISARADELAETLASQSSGTYDPTEQQRIRSLALRITALQTRIALNQGQKLPFDEESALLFDATAPVYDAAHFESILKQIDQLLPGNEPLPVRVSAFREKFIIPPDRLAAVFEAALEECRRRTLQHIDLPAGEGFTVEYVVDKPWSAYNWYQGNAQSLIQVNTEFPKYIDQAVDLGCHEGYPGHHTYNALLEAQLVKEKGWQEMSLYPLFSPQSLIAEGSGNYGIKMVFPGNERIEYEREHLFPLAGLNADDAGLYYQLVELRGQLAFAGNEAARNYLNGKFDAQQAQDWLINYTLATPERAKQSIRFFDTYRSYVINYNYGQKLVADWVEAGDADAKTRWARYIHLLSSLMLPSDLVQADTAGLPHAFEAGWQGQKTCEVLFEDATSRVGRCIFQPGIGHEKHYHNPHFGYVLEGSEMRILDDTGERKVTTRAGGTWSTDAVTIHEVVNIGATTTSYLIVEPKQDH